MSFLLDTNVVSEWVKFAPNAGVVKWLANADEDATFLSVVSVAELRFGIERSALGARRKKLEAWLTHDLAIRFEGRVLSIDPDTGEMWGRVRAYSESLGHSMSVMDAFLAATAAVHKLTIVTRNVGHFSCLKLPLLNPWVL